MKTPIKIIEKIKKLGFKEPNQPEQRTNPFTNVSNTLCPLACLLYDFITNKSYTCGIKYTRKEWDTCRYYFNATWPDAYYKLID